MPRAGGHPLRPFRRPRARSHGGRDRRARVSAALWAGRFRRRATRRAAARRPAIGHGVAVVEQGDRHRARLRVDRGAAHRTRHCLLPRRVARTHAARVVLRGGRPARSHDRAGAARSRGGGQPVPSLRAEGARNRACAGRRPSGAAGCKRESRPRAFGRRGRLPAGCLPCTRTRPDGRRADDVRAGQLRALPAQDLQRGLDRGRRTQREIALRHDPQHAREESAWRAVGLQGQLGSHRGVARAPLVRATRRWRVRRVRRADRHPDEGRDAQPPDGDLAVPRGGDGLGRRDPRRGRDRSRCEAEGGTGRLHGLEPAHPGRDTALGTGSRQARPHRVRAADHAGGADRRGFVQQRVRPPRHLRLLPHVRAAGGRARPCGASRVSQADHDRGRPRQHSPAARREIHHRPRCADRRARRPGDADRPRRRRGFFGRRRCEFRGPRFRLGAARQPGDPASRAGSHRRVLGTRGRQSHPADPRRRRRRPVERGARVGRPRRLRRSRGPAQRAERRAGDVAARNLVQRSAGALRADRRGGADRGVRRALRSRALPLRGHRRGHGGRRARRVRSAVRQRAGGDAARYAARQAAPHDARRAPGRRRRGRIRRPRDRPARRGFQAAQAADRRRQDIPGDDRRPLGGRHDQPRPARGPLAGAGERRRRDGERLFLDAWRSDGHGRALAARAARRGRVGAHGGRRVRDQHRGGGHRAHRGRAALRQLDGRLRRAWRGRRPLRRRARRRRGILPGARHRDPGRQGLALDEDGVARR